MAEQNNTGLEVLKLINQRIDIGTKDSPKILAFIKSSNVQVFPSGRRGSNRRGSSGVLNSAGSPIPFDPEARLNTEANNRKHTAVNGYSQTYLKDWDTENGILTFAVDGYLFKITLTGTVNKNEEGIVKSEDFEYKSIGSFVEEALDYADADKIYVNVVAEEVKLFSSDFSEYFTEILRNHPASDAPDASLDQLRTKRTYTSNGAKKEEILDEKHADNFYFSGVSFSTTPLVEDTSTFKSNTVKILRNEGGVETAFKQTTTSLCILEKVDGTWQLYQPALLPEVRHGTTVNSIVLGDTTIKDNLTVENHTKSKTIEATSLINTPELEVNTLKVDTISGYMKDKVNSINAAAANIDTIEGTTATIATVNSADIQQNIDGTYRDVPVIFVQSKTVNGKTEYQLQIKRANHLN